MNRRRQIAVLGLAATVLLLGFALQFLRLRDVQRGDITTPPQPIGLHARIPTAPAGWAGRDEPLGSTESVNRAVVQSLNFDDVCYRRYDKPGFSLGVYVAYWSAGRMPLQKVASHTPDRCWSENGWTCTEARFPVVLSTVGGGQKTVDGGPKAENGGRWTGNGGRWTVDGEHRDLKAESGNLKAATGNLKPESQPSALVVLKPGYWRTFIPPGGTEPTYVLYWHLVGDELYDYGGGFNRRPGIVRWWRDMLRYAFAGSREQFFIRLTSNRPFEELEDDAGFQAIIEALGGLGLAAEPR